MASAPIQIAVGQNILTYNGSADLALSTLPDYTAAKVDRVQIINTSGAGYTSGRPGSSIGVTSLKATTTAKKTGFILVAKQAFTLDAALFGVLPKPTISSIFPTSVAQMGTLNLTGTNMDTVDYVFVAGVQCAINSGTTTSTNLAVTVPLTAPTGSNKPVIVLSLSGYAVVSNLTITAASVQKLAKPVIVTPISVTSSTATFSLSAPVPNANGYFFRLNSGMVFPLGNVTTYTATGLAPSAVVTGEFYATDTTGAYTNSDYSVLVSATTLPANATKLEKPVLAPATNITSSGFGANWTAIAGADGYRVLLNGTDQYLVAGNQTFYDAVGQAASSAIKIKVQAFDSTGVKSPSDYSDEQTVVTNAPVAPTPTITSFSPSTARVGDKVTVTGTNFGALQGLYGKVKANGILSNTYDWNDTQFIMKVPVGGASGLLEATAADGQKVVSATPLTVMPALRPEYETTNAVQNTAISCSPTEENGNLLLIQHLAFASSTTFALSATFKARKLGSDAGEVNDLIRTVEKPANHFLGFKDFGTTLAFGLVFETQDGQGIYTELKVPVTPDDFVGNWAYAEGCYDGTTMRIYRKFPNGLMEQLPGELAVTGTVMATNDAVLFLGRGEGAPGSGFSRFYGDIAQFAYWHERTPATRLAYAFNAFPISVTLFGIPYAATPPDVALYGDAIPGLILGQRFDRTTPYPNQEYDTTVGPTALSLRKPISSDPIPTISYDSATRQLTATNNVPGTMLEYRAYGGLPQSYAAPITVSDRYQDEGKYEFRIIGSANRLPSAWAMSPVVESASYLTSFARCDMTAANTDFTVSQNVTLTFSNLSSTFTAGQLPQNIAATAVRGGNSTKNLPKPRFNIVLASKQTLFGFPTETDFRFLADARAPDLEATIHALYLSQSLGIATPKFQLFILYINGSFGGVYIATQKIKLGMLTTDKPAAGDTANFPALIVKSADFQETDENGVAYAGKVKINTPFYDGTTNYPGPAAAGMGHSIVIDNLKTTSPQVQIDEVQASLTTVENTVATNDWVAAQTVLDGGSVIAYGALNDYLRNHDAEGQSSYMYRLRGGKWIFGPSWDFDASLSIRNAFSAVGPGPGKFLPITPYFSHFFASPAFLVDYKNYLLSTFAGKAVAAMDYANEAGYLLQVLGYADQEEATYHMRTDTQNYFVGDTAAVTNYREQRERIQAGRVRQLNYELQTYAG